MKTNTKRWLAVFIISVVIVTVGYQVSNILAEDDDEQEYREDVFQPEPENEDEDEPEVEKEEKNSSAQTSKKDDSESNKEEDVKETIVVENDVPISSVPTFAPVAVPEIPIPQAVAVDSDNDGLADDKDPHPQIPEVYIVEDYNRNGIVDKYEKAQ